MVAFNMNLFCVLALAVFPAVVMSDTIQPEEIKAVVTDVQEVAGGVEVVADLKFGEVVIEGSLVNSVATGEATVSGSGTGRRNLVVAHRMLLAAQIGCTATLAKTTAGSGNDVITASSIKCTGSNGVNPAISKVASGPVSLEATALGPQFGSLASAPESATAPPQKITIESAVLTIKSKQVGSIFKVTSYTLEITVRYKSPFDNRGWFTVTGDPHFKTWTGQRFDYQGQCELVLVRAPRVDLAVHIRTKIRDGYSFVESVAMQLGDDVLEVSSFGEYFFNGVENAKLPKTMSLYPLTYEKTDEKHSSFVVDLDLGQNISIYTIKDIVNFKAANASLEMFEDSVGLMGNHVSGEFMARDGITIIKNPNDFSQEWQVLDSEPQLFTSPFFEPQYPSKCILPEPIELEARRRLIENPVSRAAAEKACAHALGEEKKNCIDDVMATGDVEMALNFK